MKKPQYIQKLSKSTKLAANERPKSGELADFSTPKDVWKVTLLSVVVGLGAAVIALVLLDLIGFFTHLFYFGKIGVSLVQPTTAHFGVWTVFIPVIGGLIVGAMAYWGSEKIRGHGIPEAMETILLNGSKMEPKLTILKPISSAISIGSGGPFGAEGPIIVSGGAFGSVLAQFVRLSAIERRTLLVAGACAGMTAVFGTPVAAALFGVELLLFEWKPRTLAPIGVAVVASELLRNVFASHGLILSKPLFPVPPHGTFSTTTVIGALLIGLACAGLSWVVTNAVYKCEDLYRKLPIHWAWWPAIGGLVVGLGGLINSNALGVGYVSIGNELAGKIAIGGLVSLLLVKLVIWAVSLGSGTSGGVLAPLLMMGGALGGIMAPIMPGGSEATWALLGLAATLAGATRSPFTSVIFAFELTRDTGSLLPLMLACFASYLISTLILKRSILTEKIARRGFHISCEYSVEPLEGLLVSEVVKRDVLTFNTNADIEDIHSKITLSTSVRRQRIYPVVSEEGYLVGIVPRSSIIYHAMRSPGDKQLSDLIIKAPVLAYMGETLRSAADRMAEQEVGAVPVVADSNGNSVFIGIITEFDILRSRQRQLIEERKREVILGRFANRDI